MSIAVTAAPHTHHDSTEFSVASFSSDLAVGAALGGLDVAGRAAAGVESTIDFAAEVINTAVPATTRFVAGFLVPEAFSGIIGGTTESVVRGGTWLAAASSKAAFQSVTFGAPAWVEALRQGIAVARATSGLESEGNSHEFLARCFAESQERPVIRQALSDYLDARSELARMRDTPERDDLRISAVAERIAELEVKFREYQEFRDLKLMLGKSEEFVRDQYRRVDLLAEHTADRILQRVEDFYRDNLNGWAGEVSGPWAALASEGARNEAREKLRNSIAQRLLGVFESEMNADEVKGQLNELTSELQSTYGTYRKSFRAALYSAIGISCVSGIASELFQSGIDAGRELFGSLITYTGEGLSTALSGVEDVISAQVERAAAGARDAVADALAPIVEPFRPGVETISAGMNAGAAALQAVQETFVGIDESISSSVDSTRNWIDAVMNPVPDYSHPYWSGTNKVWMVGPDGTPVQGESCISGFPSTPRYDPGIKIDSLSEFFSEDRGGSRALLEPLSEPLAPHLREELLKSPEMKALMEYLQAP